MLKTCCHCQSLRTGSIVSGVCGILLAIACLIVMFVARVEFKTIVIDWLPSSIVKIILAINLCMTILISTLMLVGVFKRNHYLMLPWVVLGIVLAVGLLVSVIYTAVVFLIDGYILAGVLWLIFGLLSVVIYVYMWMVVYSFFTILKEENDRGRYSQPYRR
uniref:Putative conserved plasma membrane protein n=1 Tax=Nyssomyia neivai TaxID=330878 RepID=A0A1L8D8Q3_9DIPT